MTTRRPTTTEEYVTFEPGKPVSLEIPDKLFGSSFTLVTNLSTTVGDFMIIIEQYQYIDLILTNTHEVLTTHKPEYLSNKNSALRAQRLLESMRPFLQGVFGAKGVVIEAITDKPLFSDANST